MKEIIQIGPIPYSVRYQEDLRDDGTELDGWVRTSFQTIAVRPGFPKEYTTALLMHEIIHAILIQSGHHDLSQDENLIDAIAYGLSGVRVGGKPLLAIIEQLVAQLVGQGE